MLFKRAFTSSLVAVVALGQTAFAALTPAQVVVNINAVATISANANAALVPLSTSTSPSQARNIGTTLINSFNLIISELSADVQAMSATPAFTDAQAGDVVAALNGFIAIHQTLLGTVIGKHGIFAQFAVTAPIAAVLRSLEAGVDSFAFSLIALIPTKSDQVNAGAGQLRVTVQASIQTYSAVCIPSPLYPTVMPVCLSV